MVFLSALVGIYYNVIIAYTVFYFFSSLSSAVPWVDCGNWWNTVNCSTEFGENHQGIYCIHLTCDATAVEHVLKQGCFILNRYFETRLLRLCC